MAEPIEFETDEETIVLKTVYAVCPRCEGRGHHTNPAIDGNGLTREDMEDREFFEDYMNGVYDVTCYKCHGNRVVPIVDTENNSKEDLEKYEKYLEEEAFYQAMCEAERRFGA